MQAWVYLKTHSWLGARIDRATEVLEKAGADVADFGKNAIELAVSTGEAVSQVITAKRPEVWVAVGAPPGVRQRSLRKRMTRDSPPESAPGRASFWGWCGRAAGSNPRAPHRKRSRTPRQFDLPSAALKSTTTPADSDEHEGDPVHHLARSSRRTSRPGLVPPRIPIRRLRDPARRGVRLFRP